MSAESLNNCLQFTIKIQYNHQSDDDNGRDGVEMLQRRTIENRFSLRLSTSEKKEIGLQWPLIERYSVERKGQTNVYTFQNRLVKFKERENR